MHAKLIALTLGGLSAIGAQAFQGEENPLPPQPFQSTQARAFVQSQAATPVYITNGGTGVQARTGIADRAAVQAGARAITANGVATYGEN